jgi:non-ribosomal peptide synthetase component F
VAEGGDEGGLQFATVSTITADLGNTCIYPSLVSGGCLHVLTYEVATDGARFEEYAKRNPIDVLKIVPSHLGALLGSQLNGARMLPQRYLILGGEALSYELVDQIRERGAGCEVINHYGPTETTIGSLTNLVGEKNGEMKRTTTVPIGRPISNTETYSESRNESGAGGRARGVVHRWGGSVEGLLGKTGADGGKIHPRPARPRRRGSAVSYGGCVPVLAGREDRVRGPFG